MYRDRVYFTYINTNPGRTTFYVGVTNNLPARLVEHWHNRGNQDSFAGKYYCFNLIYYESYPFIEDAINREKELKKWSRKKKEELVLIKNPRLQFLNTQICGHWPPKHQNFR